MNTELKAIVKGLVDFINAIKDAVGTGGFGKLLMDFPTLVADVNAVLANKDSIDQEIKDLAKPENQADLEAYVMSQLAALGVNAKVSNIISAVLIIAQDGFKDVSALIAALKA